MDINAINNLLKSYEIIVQIAEIHINPLVEVDVSIIKGAICDSPEIKYFLIFLYLSTDNHVSDTVSL